MASPDPPNKAVAVSTPAAPITTDSLPRSSSDQKVSFSWDEGDNTLTKETSSTTMNFALSECVETKTITTTTTTKRSFPPIFVREPRPLHTLDQKEYPLARNPTPKELSSFSFDLGKYAAISDLVDLDTQHRSRAEKTRQKPQKQQKALEAPLVDSGSGSGSGTKEEDYEEFLTSTPAMSSKLQSCPTRSHSHQHERRQRATRLRVAKSSRPGHLSLPQAVADRLRRSTSRNHHSSASSAFPATPDASVGPSASRPDANDYDVDDAFSSNVPTPPVDRYPEPSPFADDDGDEEEDVEDCEEEGQLSQDSTSSSSAMRRPPRIDTVAAQSDALPSPGLSPTLAATEMSGELVPWQEDGDRIDSDNDTIDFKSEKAAVSLTEAEAAPAGNIESMLRQFDQMPDQLQSFMLYQMLRRCPRKTLRTVANVVNPAFKCDFVRALPPELSLMVLSYLDHKDMCRAAQVSKHWRSVIDTNEMGWKELMDRDGLTIPPGELERAITQGWGWQDPVGALGAERDLTNNKRLVASELQLTANVANSSALTKSNSAPTRRKRGLPAAYSDRSKRRASNNVAAVKQEQSPAAMVTQQKKEGPIAHATAAALAVPDPELGLPSLRKLHLYKSLYRRLHMIREGWTSGNVEPSHVAFAAHPRHVITCLQFDDDKIITGSDDTFIHIYDTKTGKLRTKLQGHDGGVWALQYEGNTLVSGSTDRTVRVWDIEKGLLTHVFHGHTSTVRCLRILMPTEVEDSTGKKTMMPTKPLIITGSRDSQLRVWRLPEPGARRYIPAVAPANDADCPYWIRTLQGHTHSVRAIDAHGDMLVSGSYDSTVRVWRISNGELLHILQGHSQKVYSVVLDTKRNRCISGSMDSFVRIWDLTTGQCLHTLEGHNMLVGLLDLHDDRLVSAAADSTLRIWDPENGRCRQVLSAHMGAITCFMHDARKVVSGSEKTVKMWDVANGECVKDLLTGLTGVWQVAFDDRRCVAAVQRDQMTYLEILDFGAVRDGKPKEELGKRILLRGDDIEPTSNEDDDS